MASGSLLSQNQSLSTWFLLLFILLIDKKLSAVAAVPVNVTCDCSQPIENKFSSEEAGQRYQICYSQDKPFGEVYDTEKEVCFNLLEKGPCPEGKILARDIKTLNSIDCVPTCNTEQEERKEWLAKLRSGECVVHHAQMDPSDFYE